MTHLLSLADAGIDALEDAIHERAMQSAPSDRLARRKIEGEVVSHAHAWILFDCDRLARGAVQSPHGGRNGSA